jgi:hypothetical protein
MQPKFASCGHKSLSDLPVILVIKCISPWLLCFSPTRKVATEFEHSDDVAASKADVPDDKRKGRHIDETMMKELLENPTIVDWAAEYWAEILRCSKSTVHDSKNLGKDHAKLREAEKATQTRHKSSDKRRLGHKRQEPG